MYYCIGLKSRILDSEISILSSCDMSRRLFLRLIVVVMKQTSD